MANNDKGFILPIAIILSLLFSSVVIHYINLLETDRLFLQERKNFFHHNLLLQSAANEMLLQLENFDTIEMNGNFDYSHGSVTYEIKQSDEFTVTVEFISKTELDGQRKATVYYDREKKAITRWME